MANPNLQVLQTEVMVRMVAGGRRGGVRRGETGATAVSGRSTAGWRYMNTVKIQGQVSAGAVRDGDDYDYGTGLDAAEGEDDERGL